MKRVLFAIPLAVALFASPAAKAQQPARAVALVGDLNKLLTFNTTGKQQQQTSCPGGCGGSIGACPHSPENSTALLAMLGFTGFFFGRRLMRSRSIRQDVAIASA